MCSSSVQMGTGAAMLLTSSSFMAVTVKKVTFTSWKIFRVKSVCGSIVDQFWPEHLQGDNLGSFRKFEHRHQPVRFVNLCVLEGVGNSLDLPLWYSVGHHSASVTVGVFIVVL